MSDTVRDSNRLYGILKNNISEAAMTEYIKNILGVIKDYDNENDSNLELVLKTYLDCNGSVKQAAAKMYVHRNTVNYKIQKVEQLTGKDISLLGTREEFDTAFMMQEILDGLNG